MAFFLIPLAILCLVGIKCTGKGFRDDYMSPESTTAVNGIFTVLVMMSHIVDSYEAGGFADELFTRYIHFGQLVVVTFFFYSGYGIAESLRRKSGYVQKMPKNRIFRVWLNLAIALIPYILLNLFTHEPMTVKQVLLSFIGYDSVGNSNWFMFDTLVVYVLVWLSFLICRSRPIPGTVLTTVGVLAFIAVQILAGRPSHWWNTVIFYPLGMWFSFLRPTAEKIITKNNAVYTTFLVSFALLFAGTHALYLKKAKLLFFLMSAAFMMALIITFLMKFTVCNRVLLLLGQNVFGIYILQRLPMRLIIAMGWNINKYVYTIIIALSTAVLAFFFKKLTDAIARKLFAPASADVSRQVREGERE